MLYFIWSNPNKTFTVVSAVAINVMVQCSETELYHYINANGISRYSVGFNYSTVLIFVICWSWWLRVEAKNGCSVVSNGRSVIWHWLSVMNDDC